MNTGGQQDQLPIDDNAVVSMHYRLCDGAGKEIDSSSGSLPLVYMHNTDALLPSLERELTGKLKGDAVDVVIFPDDAYGYADEALRQNLPRERFEDIENLQTGMRVRAVNDDKTEMMTVLQIDDESVLVDFNHPLAGQVLHFEIVIIDVRDPTAEEIAQGYANRTNANA